MSQQSFISDMPLRPLGDEVLSSLDTVKSLTPPAGAVYAYLQAVTAQVRWRDGGSDPTSTIGGFLTHEAPGIYYSGDLSAIKFIRVSGTPTLFVSYYAPMQGSDQLAQ